jgi:CRP/FNR family cyclic AMP-dependent transcriptional regulator
MTTQPVPPALPKIALFEGLSDFELVWLRQRLNRKMFPAGYNVITWQQPGEVVYIILQGTLKVHLEQLDGTDVILSIMGPGDVVGEMSLIDDVNRSANVTAQERSDLLWMDGTTFKEALERIPVLSRNLLKILAGRIRMADEQIQALASLDVYGRVARQIMAFGDRYGVPGEGHGVRIPIRLTQSDLSSLVGASRKRVNQVMVFFKQSGCVHVDDNGHITILDPEPLRKAFQPYP